MAQPRIDGAGAVPHLPAIAAVPIPAVPGSSGSRIATTSNPADQEAFMQKADAVFKLTAPKETALDVKKPPTELAPKPIKPRRRRSATATAKKGIRTVPTSDSSSSSPSLLQHGGSSGLTSAAAGEDDFSLGEWEGDELVDELLEEDVIAAAMEEELAGGDEILAAMQELAGGDEVTAAMQEVAGGDEITAAM